MRFSPLLVSSLIVEPLRYFFANYTKQEGLIWDADEKIATMEVGTVNDFNKIPLQQKPRVLVDRGNYRIDKSGLTDNMTEAKGGIKAVFGAMERSNLVWVNGEAQIIIEARNEGTVELLTDMVTHFIAGTRPLLCSDQGFKELGLPMAISSCSVDKEDIEKFKATISFPYAMEDQWLVKFDAITFKSMYAKLVPWYNPGFTGVLTETVISN